ncbi:ABC transporter substrate-binding protein [Catenulispora rubra]|uniref:ABC transporter substrate-binding protein n=1 Tax=Catenulispora rubra TaxID=280293 RepID=UPI00189260D8|nr:ABC transporter substrate-binding protein [Catenulispora rubra]
MPNTTRVRLAALAAFGLLATASGCTSNHHAQGPGSTAPTADSTKPTTTTQAASGVLDSITWALPMGEPTTLDPAKSGDYSPNTVEANMCDSLLRVKPDYSYGPGLAQSWKWSDDKTLVLEIRPDVTFWDGNPLTADDVAFSLNREIDPANQSVNAPYFASVASIAATGSHEVTLKFSQPDELFFKVLSTEAGAVSEQAYVKKQGANYGQAAGGLMCSGPYEFGSWSSGQSVTITANPHYWDPTLQPKIHQVQFKFVPDASALSTGLLSGQIDGSYEVPLTTMKALANSKIGTRHYGISTQSTALALANPDTPLADQRLDQALALTLDDNALIKDVYGGSAAMLKTAVPPTVWQGSDQASIYKQGYDALPDVPASPDIAKAKALVAQAAPSRRTFTVAMAAGDQASLQLLTFLQAGAKQIGLDFTIKQFQAVDFSNLFYDASKRAGLDLVVANGYVEVPDPLASAPALVTPDGTFNWNKYSNDTVTSLLRQAQSSLDPAKSAQLFVQAQAIYTKDMPGIFDAAPNEQMFMNKRISGAPASLAYLNIPWAAMIGGTGK